MKSKGKWIGNLLFLILVITATLYGLFRNQDLGELMELISGADWRWWSLGFVCVVLFILGESLVFHVIFAALRTPHRMTHCFLYSFVGFFFSCITPSAGGGQPAQVYFMRKDGISSAISVPVMILVTITFKMVLILSGVLVFLFRPPAIISALEPVIGWCILGMFLNVSFVSFYLLLIFRPAIVERMMHFCLRLWEKLFKKNAEKHREALRDYMERYRGAAECFRSKRLMVVQVMILSILQRGILFAVTWLSMRAFGLHANPVQVIVLQSIISLSTDLLPLPGGMGASETLFMYIFPILCGPELTLPVLMVSRGISYYGQLLISAVFTLVAAFCLGTSKREKEIHEE